MLYLRAFADDGLRVRSARPRRTGVLNRLDPRGFDRFEQVIARALGDRGPVVGVDAPGTDLAPLGAARESFGQGEWQPEVRKRICQAGWIAIGAARGSIADGFGWELCRITELKRWPSVLLVLPPVPAAEQQDAWNVFTSFVDEVTGMKHHLPLVVGDALVVFGTAATGWTVMTADRRDEWSYDAALDQAVDLIEAAGGQVLLDVRDEVAARS